jgi:hypothetical protein
MTTLVENPLPIIFLGIAAEAMLAIAFLNTRQAVFGWVMLGVLIVVLAGVGLELWIVTDVERVEETLYGAAEALEANDLQRVNQYILPSANRTRTRAELGLEAVELVSVKISSLKIKVDRSATPPTAEAEFTGAARFEPRRRDIYYKNWAAKFTVVLQLEGDRWLVTDSVNFQEVGS